MFLNFTSYFPMMFEPRSHQENLINLENCRDRRHHLETLENGRNSRAHAAVAIAIQRWREKRVRSPTWSKLFRFRKNATNSLSRGPEDLEPTAQKEMLQNYSNLDYPAHDLWFICLFQSFSLPRLRTSGQNRLSDRQLAEFVYRVVVHGHCEVPAKCHS